MPTLPKSKSLPWIKNRPFEGMKEANGFYNSNAWRRFRHQYIKEHPLCVMCYQRGDIVSASVVDHITPIADGGAKFDTSNCQSLCASCHNTKSIKQRWAGKDQKAT